MKKVIQKLRQGNERSIKIKRNIFYSFFFKSVDALVYFLIVPATLGFLDKYSYGIWLTLNSILLWINTFDAGLGNGMRNCLTVSLAKEDFEKSRIYISTTYFLLLMISCVVFVLFLLACHFIDWYSLLNVNAAVIPNLNEVIIFSFLFFCLSFVFKLIGNIYMALQLPAVNFFFMGAGHLLSLLIILALRFICSHGDLLCVGIAYSASPCVVYFIGSLITFGFLYKHLRPSLKFIKVKDNSNELLNVGVNFFVIQISVLIIVSMSNVVISHMFGPDNVTPFNIANRYMGIVLMALNIVVTPIWSAVTDAKARGDEEWIKKSVLKVRKVSVLFGLVMLIMLFVSPFVYEIWIGDSVNIPFKLTALMFVYVFIQVWSTSQSYILNGLTIMRIQLYGNIFEAFIFLPLAFLLGEYWRLDGLVVAMILTNLPVALTNTVQVTKIMNHTAKGVWLK